MGTVAQCGTFNKAHGLVGICHIVDGKDLDSYHKEQQIY